MTGAMSLTSVFIALILCTGLESISSLASVAADTVAASAIYDPSVDSPSAASVAQSTTLVTSSTAAPTTSITPTVSSSGSQVSRPSSTSSGPTIHTITAGEGFNQFVPNNITANVGDIVKFIFYPLNHSVAQAEFGFPCIPRSMMNASVKTSFFSGSYVVPKIVEDLPTWNLTVNDADPIFFYCTAPGGCLDYEMIGSINQTPHQSLASQLKRIKEVGVMLEPGEQWQSEGQGASVSSAIASATAGASGGTATSASSTQKGSSQSGGLATGTIAGICSAGGVVILLFYALMWFWSRNKTLRETVDLVRERDGNLSQMQSAGLMAPFGPPDSFGGQEKNPAPNSVFSSMQELHSPWLKPVVELDATATKHEKWAYAFDRLDTSYI
ncbi:hypothetical protein AAFC00_005270 [Neodothiora populina]|uniref:Extracellular serine-rich protein n=1 Tax=Neodothiora populina TaxID=2781224 RepID=A0ABR3PKC9_9PEZI